MIFKEFHVDKFFMDFLILRLIFLYIYNSN